MNDFLKYADRDGDIVVNMGLVAFDDQNVDRLREYWTRLTFRLVKEYPMFIASYRYRK